MTSAAVEVGQQAGVRTITLVDVDNRNALSSRLVAEFIAAIEEADRSPETRVVVVTNAGRVFCAGADLSERSGDAPPPVDPAELFGRIRSSAKPFIGKIAGHAMAGGLGLAAAMDISVVSDEARFGFTEVRVGVAPAIISVICLPKMRPADGAASMLRGNRFDAAEAVRLGLFNAAVPRDELDVAVEVIAGDLLQGSPAAIAATKQLLVEVPERPFEDALSWAAELSNKLFHGPEAAEGMQAFLEKRPPAWVARDTEAT